MLSMDNWCSGRCGHRPRVGKPFPVPADGVLTSHFLWFIMLSMDNLVQWSVWTPTTGRKAIPRTRGWCPHQPLSRVYHALHGQLV